MIYVTLRPVGGGRCGGCPPAVGGAPNKTRLAFRFVDALPPASGNIKNVNLGAFFEARGDTSPLQMNMPPKNMTPVSIHPRIKALISNLVY